MKVASTNDHYANLLTVISDTFQTGQKAAIAAVNSQLVETYWKIGKYIVDFEQNGEQRAKYGLGLLENLSADLSQRLGKGFSRSNLNYMRLFFTLYPICETVSHKLNWSHICELIKISDSSERQFYLLYSKGAEVPHQLSWSHWVELLKNNYIYPNVKNYKN